MNPAHPFDKQTPKTPVGTAVAEIIRDELRRCGHTIDKHTALYAAECVRDYYRERVV